MQFPLLALRSFEHLSALYRADMDLQGMAQACEDMSRVLSQAVAERSSPEYLGREFSLGGFFRVSIFGPGFPESKVGVGSKHLFSHSQSSGKPEWYSAQPLFDDVSLTVVAFAGIRVPCQGTQAPV